MTYMWSSGPPLTLDRENLSVRAAEHRVVADQKLGCHPPENGKGGPTGKASCASARVGSKYPRVTPASGAKLVQWPCMNAAAMRWEHLAVQTL